MPATFEILGGLLNGAQLVIVGERAPLSSRLPGVLEKRNLDRMVTAPLFL